MHLTFCNVNDAFTHLVSGIHNSLSARVDPDSIPDHPHFILTYPTPSRYGAVHRICGGPVTLTYLYPCQRVLWNSARDCNPFFHLFECIWMLAGRNDIAPLVYFNKKYADFSDDGKTVWGAYGHRWRHTPVLGIKSPAVTGTAQYSSPGWDQIQTAIDILRVDPRSRRVVLQMWNPGDLERVKHSPTCRDVPCNTEILLDIRNGLLDPGPSGPSQPLPSFATQVWLQDRDGTPQLARMCQTCKGTGSVQEEHGPGAVETLGCPHCQGSGYQPVPPPKKNPRHRPVHQTKNDHELNQFLDMTVINRSNDMVWGCLGANYVHMSFLQEYIACSLGIKVGLYHQVTNNLHIYENNWHPDKWLSDLQPLTPGGLSDAGHTYGIDPYMSRHDPYPNPPIFQMGELATTSPAQSRGQDKFDRDCEQLFSVWDDRQSFDILSSVGGFMPETPFFQDVIQPLIQAWNFHLARNYELAILQAERITHSDWRLACKQWLQRRQSKFDSRSSSLSDPQGSSSPSNPRGPGTEDGYSVKPSGSSGSARVHLPPSDS